MRSKRVGKTDVRAEVKSLLRELAGKGGAVWEVGEPRTFPEEAIDASREHRRAKLRAFEKKCHLPASFRDFVEEAGYVGVHRSLTAPIWAQIQLEPLEDRIVRGDARSFVGRDLFENGKAIGGFAVPQQDLHAWALVALPGPLPEAGLWCLIDSGDITHPDGAPIAPLGTTFHHVVAASILGLSDVLAASSVRRAKLLKTLRRLTTAQGALALDLLAQLRTAIEASSAQGWEQIVLRGVERPEAARNTKRSPRPQVIVMTPAEIPSGPKLCRKYGRPQWVDVPFLFTAGQDVVSDLVKDLPDRVDLTKDDLKRRVDVGHELYEYLCRHGGCPVGHTFFPGYSREEVCRAFEGACEIRLVQDGSTKRWYSLADGADVVLSRIDETTRLLRR